MVEIANWREMTNEEKWTVVMRLSATGSEA